MNQESESNGGTSVRERVDRGFENWGRWVADHSRQIIAVTLLATVALATNARHVNLDTDPEKFLNADHPTRIQYDAFKRDFGMDNTVLLAIQSDEIWTLEFLGWLRELHLALEEHVPHADEVTSLINARLTRGEADELIVENLMAIETRDAALGMRAALELVHDRARLFEMTGGATPGGPDEGGRGLEGVRFGAAAVHQHGRHDQ